MAKVRSPNFPVIDLNTAIEAVAKIYAREKRGSFPQLSAANHLGYTSINGRSLGMFAALRAYGLVEGRGDNLAVTADAIALIEAPADSIDRANALTRAFSGPPMFNRIAEQYPEPPSEQTLRWWLIQQGFTADGADKAADIYLESRKLVTHLPKEYTAAFESELSMQVSTVESPKPRIVEAVGFSGRTTLGQPDFIVKLGEGVIALIEIKGGNAGPKQLKKLERFIKLQREFLEDDDDDMQELAIDGHGDTLLNP